MLYYLLTLAERDCSIFTSAMKTLNRVNLIGHLGSDPICRAINESIKVAHATIATNDTFRDKLGKMNTITEWHQLIFWGKLALIVEQHLRKGSLIHVEGKLKSRVYDDKQGVRRVVIEIIVEDLIILKQPNDAH